MRTVFVIAGKELRASFVTPLAYVIIAGFVLISGFFFFTMVNQFNTFLQQAGLFPNLKPNLNEWVVIPFYRTMEVVLVFLIPVLTMRAFAEEHAQGTFELLATSPLSVMDMVLGKALGLSGVIFLMLLLSFVFPFSLVVFADPEVIPVYLGFCGLVLFAFAYAALGLAVSSFTRSQTMAGVVSLVLLLLFTFIDKPAKKLGPPLQTVLERLGPLNHSENFFKGVFEGSTFIYFMSLIVLGLFLANRGVEAERSG